MFQDNLSDLLSIADQMNVLLRRVLQSIEYQGGSTWHLNRLLADAKGEHVLIDAFAREVIGTVWKLASTVLNLESVDFDCSPAEFLGQYPDVPIATGASPSPQAEREWSEPDRPRKNLVCGYTLVHSQAPQLAASILGMNMGMHCEHAGWRELIAYAHAIQELGIQEISDCEILAAGSRSVIRGQIQSTFPRLDGTPFLIGWHGVKRSTEDRFLNNCFYLVRTYSASAT